MKKYLFLLIILFYLLAPSALFLTGEAIAANKFWWASCLNGGGDCLDGIDGNDLTAGDGALVAVDAGSTTPNVYFYRLYASGATEAPPAVIAPDSNPGTKRWHLVHIYAKSFQGVADDGNNRFDMNINTSRSPVSGHAELYPEGTSTDSRWKMSNQISSTTTEDQIVGAATSDTFTNKTFDADGTGNALSNIDAANVKAILKTDGACVIIGDGTNAITTGTKWNTAFRVPFKHTLDKVILTTSETSGSITIDIWSDVPGATTGLSALTDADSLFDVSPEPTISNASTDNYVEVTSFDSGEASNNAGDWYVVNVDSVATLKMVNVCFEFSRVD